MTEPLPKYHTSPTRSRLDSLVSRAVTYAGKAKYNRYVLCLIASRIVGKYEKGATERLAQNIGVTVSRVQDYSHAGDAYRFFRRFGLNSEIAMGVSSDHLADAWLWFNKCEMPPEEIVADLRTASESKMTREQFGALMRQHYSEKPTPEWGQQLAKIENRLATLSVDTDVPEPARVMLSDLGRIAKRAAVDEPIHVKSLWAILVHVKRILGDKESDGDSLAWATAQLEWLNKRLEIRGEK
jgi:hypothetical protein